MSKFIPGMTRIQEADELRAEIEAVEEPAQAEPEPDLSDDGLFGRFVAHQKQAEPTPSPEALQAAQKLCGVIDPEPPHAYELDYCDKCYPIALALDAFAARREKVWTDNLPHMIKGAVAAERAEWAEKLADAVATAKAREREACAEIADEYPGLQADAIAHAIRARGGK